MSYCRMPPFDSEAETLEALREVMLEINWLLSSLTCTLSIDSCKAAVIISSQYNSQSSRTSMGGTWKSNLQYCKGQVKDQPAGRHSCWGCLKPSSCTVHLSWNCFCPFYTYFLLHYQMGNCFSDRLSSEVCSLMREHKHHWSHLPLKTQECLKDEFKFQHFAVASSQLRQDSESLELQNQRGLG